MNTQVINEQMLSLCLWKLETDCENIDKHTIEDVETQNLKDLDKNLPKSSLVHKVPQLQWDPTSRYLAVAYSDKVRILDRNKKLIDELTLTDPFVAMDWDKDGEFLGILYKKSHNVLLWNFETKQTSCLDLSFEEQPCFLRWNTKGKTLAVGTCLGNAKLYNKLTNTTTVVNTAEQSPITCGDWNCDNILVLSFERKLIKIFDDNGDLLQSGELKDTGYDAQFVFRDMISLDMGHKTILLYPLSDEYCTIEMAFQKYGDIRAFQWHDDKRQMMVGFENGYVITIFLDSKTTCETSSFKIHQKLHDVCYVGDCLVSCGDDGLWMNGMEEPLKLDGIPIKIEFSNDKQNIAVITENGFVYNFKPNI